MECKEIEWNVKKWNRMKSNGMECNRIKWNVKEKNGI